MYTFISGFLSLVYSESRRMAKGTFSSYFWFILMVSISAYSLSIQKYVDMNIDRSIMTSKYGNNPMIDVLIFTTSYAVSIASAILSGKVPSMTFPISIGVIFFIVFTLLLGLTLMGNFIIKKASLTFAGEKEKKPLYIMAISPQTRASIYIGKFMGILFLALPMIGFLYIITQWAFTSLFSSQFNLSELVLKIALMTALLFASAGMLVSVLCKNEKTASWIGKRIVTFMAALTTAWISIPFIEFILNVLNNSTGFLFYLDKISHLSPFTLDLIAAYTPASTGYLNIQMIASIIFLVLGMVTFIRQDLEY